MIIPPTYPPLFQPQIQLRPTPNIFEKKRATGNGLLRNIGAYWKFDETGGGGTIRIDSTGQGFDLSDLNANVGSVAALLNDGCDFTTSTYGLESATPAPHGGDISFSCWFIDQGSSSFPIVFFQSDDFSVYEFDTASGGLTAATYTTDGGFQAQTGIQLAMGFWHNIIGTRNAVTGALKLYLDSVLSATVMMTGTIQDTWPDVVDVGNGSGGGIVFGYMDESAFWNKELTQTDVDNIFNGGSPLPFANYTL